jgi:hypothetical protein
VNRGRGLRLWPSNAGGIRQTPPFPLFNLRELARRVLDEAVRGVGHDGVDRALVSSRQPLEGVREMELVEPGVPEGAARAAPGLSRRVHGPFPGAPRSIRGGRRRFKCASLASERSRPSSHPSVARPRGRNLGASTTKSPSPRRHREALAFLVSWW